MKFRAAWDNAGRQLFGSLNHCFLHPLPATLLLVKLSETDERHLHAAEGWLDLDEPVEAAKELEHISETVRGHPAFLLIRCRVYLETHRPDYTHTIALRLTDTLPESPDAWFYLASACARLGQNENVEPALSRCFGAAIKMGEMDEWQKRVANSRDLEGLAR